MRRYAPALAGCRVLVSCDGYKLRDQPRYRSGGRRGEAASTRVEDASQAAR